MIKIISFNNSIQYAAENATAREEADQMLTGPNSPWKLLTITTTTGINIGLLTHHYHFHRVTPKRAP